MLSTSARLLAMRSPILTMPHSSKPSSSHALTDRSYSAVKVQKAVPETFSSKVDKKAQAERVISILEEDGMLPKERIRSEVNWFYEDLGIDITYFIMENAETIAGHIVSLYAAKISEYAKNTGHINIELQKRTNNSAVFIHSSEPGVSLSESQWERKIDVEYLNKPDVNHAYRLESYRSTGVVAENAPEQLRCYFLQECNFAEPVPNLYSEAARDIRSVADKTFLTKTSEPILKIYEDVMQQALEHDGPAIEMFQVENSSEHHIVVGYRMGSTSNFFSAVTDLCHYYGLYSTRKSVEHFSNGITIMSIYLKPMPSEAPPINISIYRVLEEVSLIYALPDNPFFSVHEGESKLGVQEATYAYVGWLFAQHFCNRLGTAYEALREIIDESDSHQLAILHDIKLRLREETFTRQSIFEVIKSFPHIVRLLYARFSHTHYSQQTHMTNDEPTSAHYKLMSEKPLSEQELYDTIIESASNSHERQVLLALLAFNKSVLKTNFYTPTKVALSFRLDPSFLPKSEYPISPYGVIFVVGSDFRGFHVRFRDVARGGIRIVRSRNKENYSINQRTLFDENYDLARTQHLKNKDIPEGGAKGTILPNLGADPSRCFEKYVDSVLDLLIKDTSGIKEPIVDLVGSEEILFFGPDEGTANMMDWGAEHARLRGAPWWKSFTTGKTASTLGGVPHDEFGMTTLSIRQYIHGIINFLGLKEEDVTKVQTGGPDGDLGSNEILQSKDKTVAIIDGSGVLHDPIGLDRGELVRLAKERRMISHFDVSKLSPEGYRVLVEDRNVTLPSGQVITDGFAFRNRAHLLFKADLFVPCGGRPESINISNVNELIKDGDKCNYKYIVEGANLFITRQARLELEKHGVILYPDASANKGGVTSSSLEVLVGLSLSDDEYISNMLFVDGKPTQFYMDYVRDIQTNIARNAHSEFEAIWREHKDTGKPRSLISTDMSNALNRLSLQIENTNLFDQEVLRSKILKLVFPETLVNKVGLDVLVKRVPKSYLKSAFAAQVAAGFIYAKGPRASYVDFYDYVSALLQSS